MRRCVIIGGADIADYQWVCSHLRRDDFCIYCDSGLRHIEGLGMEPSLIVGDFDSHEDPRLPVETITLPCVKDDTDTAFAVKEALSRGFDDFLLLGAAGGRLDHTLGNIALLLMLDSVGKTAVLVDDYSESSIVSHQAFIEDKYEFFSLLNISGDAKGVFVENAKYPLENAEISCEYPLGVSNEPLCGKTARVTVKEGRLLLIKIAK